jgi:hypothetical protein
MPVLANRFSPIVAPPDDCEKIPLEWLSAALHAEVRSFSTRVCSEGQVAITVVLHDIKYVADQPDRPRSVAIKMHPAAAEGRVFGTMSGLFSTEVWFYTTFHEHLPNTLCPEALGIWTDGGKPGIDNIEFFALMMEDLTIKYDSYSVDSSPTPQQVEDIALNTMVPFHATLWDKCDLVDAHPALVKGDGTLLGDMVFLIEQFSDAWPKVRAAWPQHAEFEGPLSASGFPTSWPIETLDRLAVPGAMQELYAKAAAVWSTRVQTAIHGDFNTGMLSPHTTQLEPKHSRTLSPRDLS